MKPRILLIDNDPQIETMLKPNIEKLGYAVTFVDTLEKGIDELDQGFFHLAVVDVRLTDEQSILDMSGLELLDKKGYKDLKKLVITSYPSYEVYDRAAEYNARVLSKSDPRRIFEKIQEELKPIMEGNKPKILNRMPVSNLYQHIFKVVLPDAPAPNTEELESVLEHTYSKYQSIQILGVVWTRQKRVCLLVDMFKEHAFGIRAILVIGTIDSLNSERATFQKYASGDTQPFNTELGAARFDSYRLCTQAYFLKQCNDREVFRLSYAMGLCGSEHISKILHNFYEQTLKSWYHRKDGLQDIPNLSVYARQFISKIFNSDLDKDIDNTVRTFASMSDEFWIEDNQWIFQINGDRRTFPSPLDIDIPVVSCRQVISPGFINGDVILTDGIEHTWLTDFINVGSRPVIQDYTFTLSELCHEWNSLSLKQQWALHQNNEEIADKTPSFDRAVAGFRTVMALIDRLNLDPMVINIALYHHVFAKILSVNPRVGIPARRKQRLLGTCLHLAILGRAITNQQEKTPSKKDEGLALQLIPEKRLIIIRDKEHKLSSRRFALVKYLVEQEKPCSREDISIAVWGDYLGDNKAITRVNTMVMRIREQIGADIIKTHDDGYSI